RFAGHTSLPRLLQRAAPACDDTLTANSSGGFSLSRRHASEIDRLGQLYVHGHSSPVVVLEGPDETVCRDAVRRLARNAGRPLRLVNLSTLRGTGVSAAAVRTLALEAQLENSIVCIDGLEVALDLDSR